ncbi:uncharacterized protein [Sagmatias obliquidens]|uniref:uncharacterized protein n=1 Tax=Sagmatias obliquidens TaxID=3371155 RepID=UPI000F442CCF|nr:uncharacterized protein LOC113622178 [Lagenorhynchus obliquidens]
MIRGSCQELLQKDLEGCRSVQEISLSGLTGSFVFSEDDSLGSGHHQWKFCLASLSSYLFLRPRGWDTAVCSVELGVSRERVRQCRWRGQCGGGEPWGFSNLHFSNSFLLCTPKRLYAECSKRLTFVKWWRGPDRRGKRLVASWRQLKAGIQAASLPFSARKQAKVRGAGGKREGASCFQTRISWATSSATSPQLLGAPLGRPLSKECSTWKFRSGFQEKPLGIQGQGCWAGAGLRTRRQWLLGGGGERTSWHIALGLCQARFFYGFGPCVCLCGLYACSHSFHPHDNPVRWVLLLPHVTGKGTVAERG